MFRNKEENRSFTEIIESLTTRTLHSSAIIASALSSEIEVEFDLHDWAQFMDFSWESERGILSKLSELRENTWKVVYRTNFI